VGEGHALADGGKVHNAKVEHLSFMPVNARAFAHFLAGKSFPTNFLAAFPWERFPSFLHLLFGKNFLFPR